MLACISAGQATLKAASLIAPTGSLDSKSVLIKEQSEAGAGRLANVTVGVWGVNVYRKSRNKAVGRVSTAAWADLKGVLTYSESAFWLFRGDQKGHSKVLTQSKATMVEQCRQSL